MLASGLIQTSLGLLNNLFLKLPSTTFTFLSGEIVYRVFVSSAQVYKFVCASKHRLLVCLYGFRKVESFFLAFYSMIRSFGWLVKKTFLARSNTKPSVKLNPSTNF